MKKFFVMLSVVILTTFFIGCFSNAPDKTGTTGSIVINFSQDIAMLLAPGTDMQVAGYDILGTGPNGASFSKTITGGTGEIQNLVFGSWNIDVMAKNAAGTVIYQGQGSTTVHAGQTSNLTVTVRPVSGTGSLNLTVNWNAGDTENPSVVAQLLPSSGAPINLTFQVTNGNQATCVTNAVPTGYYTLNLKLLDSGLLTFGAVEVVRIVNNATTTGVYNFTEINKQNGNIIVNIIQQMNNPITVTMTGQTSPLYIGQTMNITASVPDATGEVVYVWYINGESKGTGATYPVSGLAAGVYRIDVTAFTTDGLRAGSASYTFHVVQGTVYTVTYNGNGNTGGNIPSDPGGYLQGQQVTVSGNTGSLVKTGYIFNGWNTQADGNGTSYTQGNTFSMGTGNVVLYAQWKLAAKITMIKAGLQFTMVLKEDGTLWGMGNNENGQLGVGDGTAGTYQFKPYMVMSGVVSVGAGWYHTMILKSDGTLWGTGKNNYGQLGDGTNINKTSPVQVMSGVAAVYVGSQHTMVVKNDGTVWATGLNSSGQLGDGTWIDKNTPVQITSGVKSISLGSADSMIVKNDETLWGAGQNGWGEFGNGTNAPSNSFILITNGIASVSMGNNSSMWIRTDGTLWGAGVNMYGQLGDGTTIQRLTAVQVMAGVSRVYTGIFYTLILKNDNTLWSTGSNNLGQLGDGTIDGRRTPVQIMTGVVDVSAGMSHTMILREDGTLWGTGNNGYGELGNGTNVGNGNTTYFTVPVQIDHTVW